MTSSSPTCPPLLPSKCDFRLDAVNAFWPPAPTTPWPHFFEVRLCSELLVHYFIVGQCRSTLLAVTVCTVALYQSLRTQPPPLSRDHNCDSTTIRLRYDDTTTHSTTTEVIEITIRLRSDYDPTTTYRARLLRSIRHDSTRAKNEHVNFSS